MKKTIYIASKVKHASRWRELRANGANIISTWIDETEVGQSQDLNDLWHRCVKEAATADFLVLYREPEENLKGAWVELGAALACGTTVFAIGIGEYTVAHDRRIRHFDRIEDAFELIK